MYEVSSECSEKQCFCCFSLLVSDMVELKEKPKLQPIRQALSNSYCKFRGTTTTKNKNNDNFPETKDLISSSDLHRRKWTSPTGINKKMKKRKKNLCPNNKAGTNMFPTVAEHAQKDVFSAKQKVKWSSCDVVTQVSSVAHPILVCGPSSEPRLFSYYFTLLSPKVFSLLFSFISQLKCFFYYFYFSLI